MKNSVRKQLGTPGQRAAILKLLEDDDPSTRELVLSHLVGLGARGLSEMEALIPIAGPGAARLLEGARREVLDRRKDGRLRERCARIGTLAEFEDFCWLLAEWVRPISKQGEARAMLDEWGKTVHDRLTAAMSDEARIEVLRSVLARQEGFTGNKTDYYDPANSLLDAVVASRKGIPLTLTTVYMFVGARAGLQVTGVDAPAHFLARVGHTFFDPFEAGRIVGTPTLGELAAVLKPAERARLFEPAPYAAIAMRMVGNLAHAFERHHNLPQAARLSRVADWLRHSRAPGDPRSVGSGAP